MNTDKNTLHVPLERTGSASPPPYSEDDEQLSTTASTAPIIESATNFDITTAYTIPKDLSEGLPNPVFTPDSNSDCDNDNDNDKDSPPKIISHNGADNIINPTFVNSDNNNEVADPEKGDPPEDVSGKKGPKEYKGIKRYLGLLLTLCASFNFSIVVLFVKILKDYGVDAYGASFWRFTGTVIPTIPLLFFYECGPGVKKESSVFSSVWPIFKNENWKSWVGLLSRGVIGSFAVVLRYYALKYLPIGDTTVITFSTPALVTIMAHFFLKEKCGVFPMLVAFVTLCGVVIVAKPPILTGESEFSSDKMFGTGLAVGSLLCAATIVIITRKIRAVHFTVMTLVFGGVGIIQALTLMYFFAEADANLFPSGLYDSLFVAGIACISFFGQLSVVLALKFEQAGPVALVRSCDVIFGFLFQFVFLGVTPDKFSAIGAVIVLTGVLATAFRKRLITLPEDDARRKRWWFVLR